jgi:hypothetical protein
MLKVATNISRVYKKGGTQYSLNIKFKYVGFVYQYYVLTFFNYINLIISFSIIKSRKWYRTKLYLILLQRYWFTNYLFTAIYSNFNVKIDSRIIFNFFLSLQALKLMCTFNCMWIERNFINLNKINLSHFSNRLYFK